VVILNVDVYYVYRLVELAAPVKQIWSAMLEVTPQVKGFTLTIANSIVTSFLASDDDISNLLALLPSFRRQLDLPIPIEHLEQATGRVSKTQ